MPNLETFRKQAKQYLRWDRDGHYPVAHIIRYFLPRFQHLTDRQTLESSFKLGDAQELVARKSGYESWQALLKGIETMTDHAADDISRPVLMTAEPQLFVADIDTSCAFFRDKLGFAVRFTYGTPPFYAQVARDGARLNLRHVDRSPVDPQARISQDLLSATIVLDHAKPLFAEFKDAGVEFHQALRREPWGARTFIVKDPDGNLIAFAADEN